MTLNAQQLRKFAKAIYDIACAHGWHEEKKPDELWLCLVMTEIAEAVEADRKGRRADTEMFKDVLRTKGVFEDDNFKEHYKQIIKGTIEEELADIVIRLLDFANEKYGDSMDWDRPFGEVPVLTEPFPVNAWNLVKYKLFSTQSELLDSIYFVYGMANQLDIDLDQHIVWKMRYNECREYKHGGKAY